MTRKIDIDAAPVLTGTRYPAPFDAPCRERHRRCLGDAAGLTQLGVNLVRLPPGCWSSQRHWHTGEDEFVFVVEGEVVLVTDAGEELLRAGDCAGFKANDPNGHHLQNRSERDALVLDIGNRQPDRDEVFYADIDLIALKGRTGYAHRSGELYAGPPPRNAAAQSAAPPALQPGTQPKRPQ